MGQSAQLGWGNLRPGRHPGGPLYGVPLVLLEGPLSPYSPGFRIGDCGIWESKSAHLLAFKSAIMAEISAIMAGISAIMAGISPIMAGISAIMAGISAIMADLGSLLCPLGLKSVLWA